VADDVHVMYDPTAWQHPVLLVNNSPTADFVLYALHCHRPVICESIHSKSVLGVVSSVRERAEHAQPEKKEYAHVSKPNPLIGSCILC
jgi:hypothetical protein